MEEQKPVSQAGSGSAENQNQSRSEQLNRFNDADRSDKEQVAHDIHEATDAVAGLKDLGGMSGRDDAAGGSGDNMEDENTRKRTDR